MDRVLADQPPDTWDSFPLFQILNDYLRTDGMWFDEYNFFNFISFTINFDSNLVIVVVVLWSFHNK